MKEPLLTAGAEQFFSEKNNSALALGQLNSRGSDALRRLARTRFLVSTRQITY